MKFLRLVIILPLVFILSFFGRYTFVYAKMYEQTTTAIAKQSDASGLAQGKIDELTSMLTFGLIEDETKAKFDKLHTQQQKIKHTSLLYLYAFLATLALLLLLSFTCSLTAQTLIWAISSFITLVLGLISPILMVTIHKQIDYLGDVVLSFESKGILDSVLKLFDNGEHVVALTILLFSVVIPLIKIVTLILALIAKELRISSRLILFFKHLGKWSMLDVFVVSTFLVYLSSKNGDLTHAETGVGLYFFLLYILLSMVTTFQTQKVLTLKVQS